MESQKALIIPVYNGQRHILSLFVQLEAFLAVHSDWYVYIVNDGSTDNTAALLRLIPHTIANQVTVLSYVNNRGKGGAIAYAVERLGESYSYIGYTDIEIPYTFAPLISAVEIMDTNERVSVVIGDRTLSDESQYSHYRQIAHRLFRFFVPASVRKFGDTQCGLKVFRASLAKTVFAALQTTRWVFDIEILSKAIAMGATVRTVPVVIKPSCKQGVGGLTFVHSSVSVLRDIAQIRCPRVCSFVIKYKFLFSSLLLFFVTSIWYWKSLSLGFFADDFLALQVARDTSSWWSYFATNIFALKGSGSYGPVWNWIVEMQYTVFGMRPLGYHVINLVLHSLNALLLICIATRVVPKKSIAWLVGLMFLVFVGHVEAVAWFAAQVHIVAVFFLLCGMWWYIRSIETHNRRLYVMSLCAATLAIFTKEIAVTAVILYPLLGLFVRVRNQRYSLTTACVQTGKEVIPLVVSLSTYLVLRYVVTHTDALSYYGGDFSATLTVQHIFQFIWSITLSHIVPYAQRMSTLSFVLMHEGLVLLFGGVLLVWFMLKKQYYTPFALLLYVISLMPYVPLTLNRFSYEGERYGYFPGVFFALLVCTFVYELSVVLPKMKTLFVGVSIICFIVWLCGSWYVVSIKLSNWQEAHHWVQDIFTHAQVVPWSTMGHTYIIGLPDSYAGAPLLPLGFVSGMSLVSDTSIDGEQLYLNSWVQGLPKYTLTGTSVDMKCVQKKGICQWSVDQPRFIGHSTTTVAEGSFTLRMNDQKQPWGRRIIFTPTSVWCAQTTPLSFAWYDMSNGQWFFKTITPAELCIERV